MADYKEELAIKTKIADIETRINTLRTSGTSIDESARIALEERQERLQAQLKLEEEANELRNEKIENLKKEIEMLDDGLEKTQREHELNKLILEETKKKKDISAEILKEKQDAVKASEQELDDARKLNKELAQRKELESKVEGGLKKLGAIINSLTGGMFNQFTTLFSFEGAAAKFGEVLNEIQKANAEIVASTGQVGMSFGLAATKLGPLGIGFKELNKSGADLFKTMSSFSEVNVRVQTQLVVSTAKLERLGVASATSGKNFNELTKTLRMTATEAMQTNELLAQSAIGAGIAPQKMLEEFATSMPKLAAYGNQAINVYLGLQKQAKALGMEMSSLTNIVGDQFDTFEGSARAAGKLNAVLGGNYLNSVDMLNASEEERVMMIKQSLEQSGKSFDSLDKYQKKALAATLNISDMSEASKLFGTSTSEVTKSMDKQAVSQGALTGAQAATVTAAEKLEKTITNNMIPAADKLNKKMNEGVDAFTEFINKGSATESMLKWLGITIVLSLISLSGIIMTVGKTIAGFFSGTLGDAFAKTIEKVGKSVSGVIKSLASSLKKMGDPKVVLGIVGIGLAFIMIGAGIALASFGMAKLVMAFQGLTGPQAIAAIAALIVAMLGFIAIIGLLGILMIAGPGAGAVAGLLALGAAFLMVAGAIYIITEAMIKWQPLIIELGKVIMAGLVVMFDRLMAAAEKIIPYIAVVAIAALNTFLAVVRELGTFLVTVLIVAFAGIRDVLLVVISPITRIAEIVGGVLIEAFRAFVDVVKILANMFENVILGVFDKIILLSEKENISLKLIAIGGGLGSLAIGLTALIAPLTAFPNDYFDRFASAVEKLSNINLTSQGLDSFIASIKNLLNSLSRDMLKESAERLEFFAKSASSSFPVFITIAQSSAPAIIVIATSINLLTTSLKKLMEITGFSESLSAISGAIVLFANQFIALDPAIGAMNTLSETLNKLTITFTTMFNVVSGRAL